MDAEAVVDLERVVAEVEGLWSGRSAWLDRRTGRLLVLAKGRAGEGFVRLPEPDEFPLIEDFLSSLRDEDAAHGLARAFCGTSRGRAERFRAELDRRSLRDAWRDYRRAAVRRDVVERLETAGIRYR